MNNELLKDKYRGQTAWIIGTGPSVQFLSNADIGEGPVIALNHAITIVDNIGLPNDIYSSQKDGGERRNGRKGKPGGAKWFTSDCDYAGILCHDCDLVFQVKLSTFLILHDIESGACFPNHEKRFVFSFGELGLPHNEFSQAFILKLAQYMGCSRFVFVSFDAHTKGDTRNYFQEVSFPAYLSQKKKMQKYLIALDCDWITPEGKE